MRKLISKTCGPHDFTVAGQCRNFTELPPMKGLLSCVRTKPHLFGVGNRARLDLEFEPWNIVALAVLECMYQSFLMETGLRTARK